jgi:radical SAM superfamily enzyme YgiQ (UPF0313 family)
MAYLHTICLRHTSDIAIIDSIGNYTGTRAIKGDHHDFELLGQDKREIAAQIDPDTDLVLISIMFSQDWPYSKELLSEIRSRCASAKIVAGGEHVTAVPEFSLRSSPDLDLIVVGEGEASLDGILSTFGETGALPTDEPGTVYLLDGEYVDNSRRPRIKEVDSIPRPNWDGFPLANYLDNGHGFGATRGGRSMPILASRGCPYQCTFCSSPLMWTTAWKSRDPKDVLDEMEGYISRYQVTNFDFYDLTAIVKKEWIVEFTKMLIERKLNVTWQLPSGTRSEAIDDEVAPLLYESGCRNLSYAPESGSPAVLKMIKKKVDLGRMLESMKCCSTNKMSVKVNLICGFPKERIQHLLQTLPFICKLAWVGCDDMSINQFSPYPGSELFDDLTKADLVTLDEDYFQALSFYSSMTNARSYSEKLTSKQIIAFKFVGTTLFYSLNFLFHPSKMFRTMINVRNKNDTTRLEKTLISYLGRGKVALD